MIITAVFLVSLSSLAYEVILARVFSISQWNHLSFMVISIALFGFAAAGTFLSILDERRKGWETRFATAKSASLLVLLYTCSALFSFVVLGKIPLDYFRLPLEPVQALYLFSSYAVLSIPFFFAGFVVLTAYAYLPGKTGEIYFAGMVGAALGAVLPAVLLPFFEEGKLVVLVAVIPLCCLPVFRLIRGDKKNALVENDCLPVKPHLAAGKTSLGGANENYTKCEVKQATAGKAGTTTEMVQEMEEMGWAREGMRQVGEEMGQTKEEMDHAGAQRGEREGQNAKSGYRHGLGNKELFLVGVCAAALIGVVFFTSWGSEKMAVRPSQYKSMSQLLKFPDSTVTETLGSLTGRIETVTSPYIRYAPGLSLKFTGVLPPQKSIFRDGDNQFVLYGTGGVGGDFEFAGFTLPSAGYRLVPDAHSVLLILGGGGTGIPTALEAGISEPTVVHENAAVAGAVEKHYNLPATAENPRVFLKQSQGKYDIIHLENWGASLPGSSALGQEYMFTKEAFGEYLDHLSEKGVVVISRNLLLPPSDSIRLFSTAFEVLRERGIENPGDHLLLLRNWGVFTLAITKNPLENKAIPMAFAEKMNFDMVYIGNMAPTLANRYNIFDRPHHYLAVGEVARHYMAFSEAEFFREYALDVAPQDDRRPFPGRFLKWNRVGELYKSMGNRPYSLLLSGEVVVAVVFLEALGIAALLLVVPGLLSRGQKARVPLGQKVYFFSVGAGFMFVEIYFIKAYVLIFANPVISFAVVLAGILIFSGIGGWWSRALGKKAVLSSLGGLALLLVGILFCIDPLLHLLLGLPAVPRYCFAFLILAPPGILMGLPFTLGMRELLTSPLQRANAWAMNGCASVLSSIAAARLALYPGIRSIMICAAVFYIIAAISSRKTG